MYNEILETKSKFKNSTFWLGGDFNLPDINWINSTITGNQYPATINQLFLDLKDDLGLSQTVTKPTRGNNILDLFFTNNINLIKKSEVISGTSDHEAVTVLSNIYINYKKKLKEL